MQHVHAADFEGGRLFQAQHSRPSTPSSASTPRVQQLTPPITSLGDFEVFSHENELDGLRHLSLSVLEHMCACMPCFCTTQSCTPALLLLDALLPACCMEHAPAMDKPTCSKNSTNSSQLMSLSSIFRIFLSAPAGRLSERRCDAPAWILTAAALSPWQQIMNRTATPPVRRLKPLLLMGAEPLYI